MYPYLGPPGPLALVRTGGEGFPLRSPVDVDRRASPAPAADFAEPFTFTVGVDGILPLAARRSPLAVANTWRARAAGRSSLIFCRCLSCGETIIAERLTTAIDLGVTNTRDRDYADLYRLVCRHDFERARVRDATAAHSSAPRHRTEVLVRSHR